MVLKSGGKVLAVLVALVLVSGCASILSKSMYPVTINSYPNEANITIVDERGKQMYKGRTPTTITLAAGQGYFHGKSYDVTFSKEGYENQTASITPGLDGWYIGNILFGGLIGILIVDPLTGAMYKLPDTISVTLVKKMNLSNRGQQSLNIVTTNQIPGQLRKHLIRVN